MAETKLSRWELQIILRLRQARRAGHNVGFLVLLEDDKVIPRQLGKTEKIKIRFLDTRHAWHETQRPATSGGAFMQRGQLYFDIGTGLRVM